MNATDAIALLRSHRDELNAAGVIHVDLFGSVARNEASARSDIDLVASFDPERRLTLLDVVAIEDRLSDILSRPVDLLDRRALAPRVAERIKASLVHVF